MLRVDPLEIAPTNPVGAIFLSSSWSLTHYVNTR